MGSGRGLPDLLWVPGGSAAAVTRTFLGGPPAAAALGGRMEELEEPDGRGTWVPEAAFAAVPSASGTTSIADPHPSVPQGVMRRSRISFAWKCIGALTRHSAC